MLTYHHRTSTPPKINKTVAALRRHEVSPFQLVEVAAARIGATDGDVNATPILCLERARGDMIYVFVVCLCMCAWVRMIVID
jgi:hypothetical protein